MKDYLERDGFSEASRVIEELALSLLVETFLFDTHQSTLTLISPLYISILAFYVVLVAYLVCRPCVTRKPTSLPSFMLLFTLLMFIIYLLYWILDIYLLWAEYHSLLSPHSSSRGPDMHDVHWKGASSTNKDVLAPQYFATMYVQYIAQFTLIALGDFVSLWRAYVISSKPRWLYVLTMCIAVTESVTYVLIFASSSTEYFSPSVPGFVNVLANARTPLTFVGYSITGLAQLASTSLIAYKAWIHWRDVREFMHRSMRRRSLTALAIVIESGIAYLVLLVWYGAISYWGPPNSIAVYTCRFYSVPLVAMYPTLVVVLVASRRSVLERSITSLVHVDDMPPAISLADRQGCIGRARRVLCRTRSSPDKSFRGEDNIIWPEVGLGRSMGLTSIVTAPKDDNHSQTCDEDTTRSTAPSSAT